MPPRLRPALRVSFPRRTGVAALVLLLALAAAVMATAMSTMSSHAAGPGTTGRVSVDSAGAQENSSSYQSDISADGRYVAFMSFASNLVAGDTNGFYDIFVHDRVTGTTERVSVDSAGAQGNGQSLNPSISADGRYVAFHSDAINLVPGDTNPAGDIFVHDRVTGATERVSVDSAAAQGNGGSYAPSISADGRYVAFNSLASNLVPGDTNGAPDVFVHDRATGKTKRVSVGSAGAQGNDWSYAPSISGDGRYVAFDSSASNLVPGDTNGSDDVFVHDRLTGTTERVSVDSAGVEGHSYSDSPSISADGRYVAFNSDAITLVLGDTNGVLDVFVHDRVTGATERVSVDSAGAQGNGGSYAPSISAHGRYVAFLSTASNLVSGDTNNNDDVFVHDRSTVTPTPTATPTATAKRGPTPRKAVVFVQGINSSLDKHGHETAFDGIKKILKQQYGYKDADFLEYSYRGGTVDKRGNWVPKAYSCADTQQDIFNKSAPALHQLVRDYAAAHPKIEFTIVSHSLGGVIALQELGQQMLKGADTEISSVMMLDSPLNGASHDILAAIAQGVSQYFPGCPRLDGVAIQEVSAMGNETYLPALNASIVDSVQKSWGTRVITLGNYEDCLWDPGQCGFPISGSASTQIVNTAEIPDLLHLGGNCTLTCLFPSHTAILNQPSMLACFVDAQLPAPQKDYLGILGCFHNMR
jgi:Tol biopolymer transport system component